MPRERPSSCPCCGVWTYLHAGTEDKKNIVAHLKHNFDSLFLSGLDRQLEMRPGQEHERDGDHSHHVEGMIIYRDREYSTMASFSVF